MDIPSLTRTQVKEYLNVNAFAIARPEDELATLRNASVTTSSIQESLGLLAKVQEKVTLIRGNLETMRELAEKAKNPGRLRDEKRQEIFGQLRSLSAGIDVITSSFNLDGKGLLSGRKFELASGNNPVRLELADLSSSGEDSLGLSLKREGAFTDISYDTLARMRNASSDLIGLDLSEATPAEVAEGQQELADGDYRLKITYKGPDSIVEIQKMDGTTVRKVEGVDLSGSGQELVDMGVGVRFSFEKTKFETALHGDKYDYEFFGPTSLYANLKYERNLQHEMLAGEELDYARQSSVGVLRGGTIKGTTGELKVSASIAGVQEGHQDMASGQYRVKVKYEGARSSVWLYNPNGTLISTKRGLDLTGEEAISVDMETGIRIKLDPSSFTSDKRDYNVYLNYQEAEQPDELFDYKAYLKQIDKALETLEEQEWLIAATQEELTNRYQLTNQAVRSAGAGAWVTQAQSVNSMLGGTLDGNILGTLGTLYGTGSSASGQQLLLSQGDIFGSMQSALAAQANVDPTILAAMRR